MPNSIHPSFAKRCVILEGLRERTRQATAEFYQKPNIIAPVFAPRFIVKPSGNNNFEVVERATGKIIAERFGHNNATGHARELEARTAPFSGKRLGLILRDWAFRMSVMLVLFAYFGSHV